jgi:hypothetical protein
MARAGKYSSNNYFCYIHFLNVFLENFLCVETKEIIQVIYRETISESQFVW